MPRRSQSDSALLAQLIRHRQQLNSPQGLNGTTDQARNDLAEAVLRGLDLAEFAQLVEALEPTITGDEAAAAVVDVTAVEVPEPEPLTPAAAAAAVAAFYAEENAQRAKRAAAKKAREAKAAKAPAAAAAAPADSAELPAAEVTAAEVDVATQCADPGGADSPPAAAEAKPEQVVDRSIDAEQAHRYLQLLAKDPKTTRLRAFAHLFDDN
jgi:ribonuclease E